MASTEEVKQAGSKLHNAPRDISFAVLDVLHFRLHTVVTQIQNREVTQNVCFSELDVKNRAPDKLQFVQRSTCVAVHSVPAQFSALRSEPDVERTGLLRKDIDNSRADNGNNNGRQCGFCDLGEEGSENF